jgi:uncharacterized protein YprB with RNaseH-like and TPR domain
VDPKRRQLDDLMCRARDALECAAPLAPAKRDVAACLGGNERREDGIPFWEVETFAADIPCPPPDSDSLPPDRRAPPRGMAALDTQRAMVIDIETGGFAGTPVFLIGVVELGRRPLRVRQWLARDYPEEKAILRRFAAAAEERDHWVTFNGRSFDGPFLQDRCVLHQVPLAAPAVHVDVLHAARRAWRGVVPDFRLRTLEQHMLGRERIGDVPGADIPDLFHHFVRTGNAAPLAPVLEHNRLDLLATVELFGRISTAAAGAFRSGPVMMD